MVLKRDQEEQIALAIAKHPLSMADAARECNIPYMTFVYRAQQFGLYRPNQSHKGRLFDDGAKKSVPLNEILEGRRPTYKTGTLRKRLLAHGILDNSCSECGIGPEWNGKSLTLELDHINGINNDHRLENLRILCPNCHSQTSTFRGKNKKAQVVE